MSQISVMLSSASLIDTSAISASPFRLLIALGVAVGVITIIFMIVFDRQTKTNLASASMFIGMMVAFVLSFTGMILHLNSGEESEKASNTNVAHYIQEKYGVTVLDEQAIKTDIGEHATLTALPIPAKAPNGDRIQITIELADNDTDVIAFSSGAEMKKIGEDDPKS
jgi:hypothetical protein